MHRADLRLIGKTQARKLSRAQSAPGRVRLVAHQNHRLACAPQLLRQIRIDRRDARGDIDHKQQQVGDLQRNRGFRLHLGRQHVVRVRADAARVHDFKQRRSASAFRGDAIPCHPRHVMHNGDVLAGKTVEESGFADIRAANNGDGFDHGKEGDNEEGRITSDRDA